MMVPLLITDSMHASCARITLVQCCVVICRTWEKYLLNYMVRWFYGIRPVISCILHLLNIWFPWQTIVTGVEPRLAYMFYLLRHLENYCFILMKLIVYVANKLWGTCGTCLLLENYMTQGNYICETSQTFWWWHVQLEKIPCYFLCCGF